MGCQMSGRQKLQTMHAQPSLRWADGRSTMWLGTMNDIRSVICMICTGILDEVVVYGIRMT